LIIARLLNLKRSSKNSSTEWVKQRKASVDRDIGKLSLRRRRTTDRKGSIINTDFSAPPQQSQSQISISPASSSKVRDVEFYADVIVLNLLFREHLELHQKSESLAEPIRTPVASKLKQSSVKQPKSAATPPPRSHHLCCQKVLTQNLELSRLQEALLARLSLSVI